MLAAAWLLPGCASTPPPPDLLLSGETMGSAWTVKVRRGLPISRETLQAGIQAQFDAVNLALSTWRADSALSRFNEQDSGEWLAVDPELARVMDHALVWAEQSDGAYDITVGPLVNLWGFGPDPATHRVPEASAIAAARERVGWRKLQVDAATSRARKQPGVRVDLSSLGKGYGVDRVAAWLDAQGVTNYLVDLSGKLRARGHGSAGKAWSIAVETPGADAGTGTATLTPTVVSLHDESIATAGDYRRYFESGGRHYSHIIDPRTGEPVTHRTVSSTVLSADCMRADALATVFMVMPPAEALAMADRLRVPALLITREADGLVLRPSAAWRAHHP